MKTQKQKQCPLTQNFCLNSDCQWWTIAPDIRMMDNPNENMDRYGDCALKVIAEHLIDQ